MIYQITAAVPNFKNMDWTFQFYLPFIGLLCDLGKMVYTLVNKIPSIHEMGRKFSKKLFYSRQWFLQCSKR